MKQDTEGVWPETVGELMQALSRFDASTKLAVRNSPLPCIASLMVDGVEYAEIKTPIIPGKRVSLVSVDDCNDCPYCNAFVLDGKAHAYCDKEGYKLPADGGDGVGIMVLDIPEWCPLPKGGVK